MKLTEHKEFNIVDLGEVEDYVYDIEVDNDHNFFANNVLVHNSGYFSLKPMHDKLLSNISDVQKKVDIIDKFCNETLSPFIDKQTDELADYLNSYENKAVWEREVIAEKMIIVSKKRYTMKVWDSEGVRSVGEPAYKVMGLEAVKSSTPAWSRGFLKDCYKIALNGSQSELQEAVLEIRKKFDKMPVEEIAIPRGVNNLEQYADPVTIYVKGTPKNVKAALVHNWLVGKLGLKNVDLIRSGNKIKYIDLKTPNKMKQAVIGFSNHLPREFNIEDMVDRDTIFESSFLSPLQGFLDSINWKYEYVVSLEDFFA
jgi:DNA polymerase elongation subunit (family B)